MTKELKQHFDKCNKWIACSASVCPLDPDMEFTYRINGDKYCTKIFDYLENQEIAPLLLAELKKTEKKWRKILGEKFIAGILSGREQLRTVFKSP